MSFSARSPQPPLGPDGAGRGSADVRRPLPWVLGALGLLGILVVGGGIAWWTVLGGEPDAAADQSDPEEFVPEAVDDASQGAANGVEDPEAEVAEPEEQVASEVAEAEVEDPTDPSQEQLPTDPDTDSHPDEPAAPPVEDPAAAGPREQPVPWLSLVPPAGSGWSFEVFAASGLPGFEGTQPPEGYLEVFVDDGYASLGEAVREVELDAAAFGATEIGRDQPRVPGADGATSLLHSVPDEAAPFDQGILLLEVADDARPLIVVMVMLSEGAGPTVFEIEETFASVVLDADALRAATAG